MMNDQVITAKSSKCASDILPQDAEEVIPSISAPAREEHSCHACEKTDTSRMVMCDQCDDWYHYECVGVTQDVESEDWVYCKCVTAKAIRGKKLTSMKDRTPKPKSSKASTKQSKTRKPRGVSGDRKTMVKHAGEKQQKQEAAESKFRSSPAIPRITKETNRVKAESVTSSLSRKSTKALLDIQMKKVEAESALFEEEIKRKRELLERKFSLMEELVENASKAGSSRSTQISKEKVQSWLNSNKDLETASRMSDNVSLEKTCTLGSDEETEEDSSDEENERSVASFEPKKRSTPRCEKQQKSASVKRQSSVQFQPNLTRQQIAARQVVPRDLSKFTGNPEDWPMFWSTYKSTTAMSTREEENMIRLRNCLKDDALNAVRSFLMHPSTISKAMEALKLRFGQPQIIINVKAGAQYRVMRRVAPTFYFEFNNFNMGHHNDTARL